MKHFLSLADVPDLEGLLHDAKAFQTAPEQFAQAGDGKVLGMVLFNPSLRTRMSTWKAARSLGMEVITLNVTKDSWQLEFEDGTVMNQGSQEHIKEVAGVLSSYCDIIAIRAFAQLKSWEEDAAEPILSAFAKHCTVPLVNLESALHHPLQSLADLLTIQHQHLKAPKVVLSWAPHPKALPHAVPNSFCEWMQGAGVDLTVVHPEGFALNSSFTAGATIMHHQEEALKGADFVYAKNWCSSQHYGTTTSTHQDWTITADKMQLTNNGKFMHCLPVRRNVVVTDEVLDSSASLVQEQASNRVLAAQVVLKNLLKHVN